jgi:hypothetical protein
LFSGEFGTAIRVGRSGRIAFRQRVVGGGTALRADRRHENEAAYAGLRCRFCQLCRCQMIDAIIKRRADAGTDMRDAGQMDDDIDPREHGRPVDRLG